MAEAVQIQTRWVLDQDARPEVINQILVQPGAPTSDGEPDGYYLIVGHLNPPAFASAEEARAANGRVLEIEPIAKYFVSKARLRDLHTVLGRLFDPEVDDQERIDGV